MKDPRRFSVEASEEEPALLRPGEAGTRLDIDCFDLCAPWLRCAKARRRSRSLNYCPTNISRLAQRVGMLLRGLKGQAPIGVSHPAIGLKSQWGLDCPGATMPVTTSLGETVQPSEYW